MRVRHWFAALVVVFTLGVFATPALAGTITYPSPVTYGDQPTLAIAGLKPATSYVFVLYDRNYLPLFTIPFKSDATGGYSIPQFGPDQTDLPGTYTFSVITSDYSAVAANATATLSGTNTYYLMKRLGVSS